MHYGHLYHCTVQLNICFYKPHCIQNVSNIVFYTLYRRFGTKCGGCGQGISPNDLVRRARGAVYHVKCFTCVVCQRLLDTGDQLYILDEERLICRDDYIARYQGT